ncbi:MAG TPA: hypothetical protein VGC35_13060 [Allosphingosinicella sp.]
MKSLFFAAALMLGSAGLAQTGNTVNDPDQSSGPRGVTQQGTDPDGMACTPAGYNAGGGGYPMCEGAMAGGTAAGGTMAGGTASGGAMASGSTGGAMAGPLPACSRTVTDRCTQTYERGVRRR